MSWNREFRFEGIVCPDHPSGAARLWAWFYVTTESYDRDICRSRDGVPRSGMERALCSDYANACMRAIRVEARSRGLELEDGKRYVTDAVRSMGDAKSMEYLRTIAIAPIIEKKKVYRLMEAERNRYWGKRR